jgi:hypothetical protein
VQVRLSGAPARGAMRADGGWCGGEMKKYCVPYFYFISRTVKVIIKKSGHFGFVCFLSQPS